MRRLAVFAPEEVLAHSGPKAPRKGYPDLERREWSVKMCSHRYSTFQRSLSCACCGITGSVMILEWQLRSSGEDPNVRQPHFNLYAITSDGLVLLTKDHILPKSQGGRNALGNYQTMCELCNSLKGSDQIDMETVRERRKRYDEQPRTKKHTIPKTTAELICCISDEHRAAFWSNIQRTGGCWLWFGPVPKRGFPCFSIRRRHGVHSISFSRGRRGHKKNEMNAYRAAYYLTTGDFPQKGMWPTCRNRLCCNPAHMEIELDQSRQRSSGCVQPRPSVCSRTPMPSRG